MGKGKPTRGSPSRSAAAPPTTPVPISDDTIRYLYRDTNLTMLTEHERPGGDASAFSFHDTSDPGYLGCGIAVAQAALAYFGIRMSRDEIHKQFIPTHKLPFGAGIYTRPSTLREGIQNALDASGVYGVRVCREDGRTPMDALAHIERGYPVIALVENGTHYVLAVAHERDFNKFWVIDSKKPGIDVASNLDMRFDSSLAWMISHLGSVVASDAKYLPGTIIYFEPAFGGEIAASPAALELAPMVLGNATLHWNSHGLATVQVYVAMDGGEEKLMAQDPSGVASAPWIQGGHDYTFRLYAGVGHKTALVEAQVTTTHGEITASPQSLALPAGGLGTTTVHWETKGAPTGQVWVSMDGGHETLFGQDRIGTCSAPWIQAGHKYIFRLYAGESHSTMLAETRVNA